ncbi:MAG: hypothetical protein KDD55_08205 [Bdellovibrionales bacterium]|nr:hypothetical protein [Bdellovibrionales bacterium]
MTKSLRIVYLLFFCFCLGSFGLGCSSSTPRAKRAPGDVVTHEEDDESHEEKVARQEEVLRRQEVEIQRQQREMEDLQRQQFYNKALKPYTKER